MNTDLRRQYGKAGALAALTCAACFTIGFLMVLFVLPDIHVKSDLRLAAILAHPLIIQLWYLIIFIVFGSALLVLNMALFYCAHQRQRISSLSVMLGYLWAVYVLVIGCIVIGSIQYLINQPSESIETQWQAIYALQMGLGEGVEWVGAVWVLSVNIDFLKHRSAPRLIASFGIVIGIIGCATLVPYLAWAGAVFGMAQIIWFLLIGIFLLKQTKQPLPSLM